MRVWVPLIFCIPVLNFRIESNCWYEAQFLPGSSNFLRIVTAVTKAYMSSTGQGPFWIFSKGIRRLNLIFVLVMTLASVFLTVEASLLHRISKFTYRMINNNILPVGFLSTGFLLWIFINQQWSHWNGAESMSPGRAQINLSWSAFFCQLCPSSFSGVAIWNGKARWVL